jgi:hypothetical protein
MHVKAIVPDPLICPLCGRKNACVNLGVNDTEKSCWCNDPSISFPEALLAQIPPELRGKACICRFCALKFQQQKC